ncbi:MAG: ceramidase domain-containing protein [Albidovulum sp.]|nr:ceramidase domain-containing protein [Albidovulum sp.]MDE0305639.1 ceramidase domain-containing protein [Albidovulum sp.]MDE0533639.1 ceramidase domain-containing protein [Albidovulum sp.]
MEGLNAYVDAYCERMEPGLFGEPLNALTNLSFIIAAVFAWSMLGKQKLPLARALVAILFLIGVGSTLFHTFATRWAALTDVIPIAAFILVYIYVANREYLELSLVASLAGVVLFFVYAPLASFAINYLFDAIGSSSGYAAVALLIFIYAAALRKNQPRISRGLLIGGTILAVSIGFRTIDDYACARLPFGTHFMWHILNGIMLAWMIEVYRRSALEKSRA